MSSISRVTRGLIALGIAALVGQAMPAQAAPIITVTPSPSVVVQNGTSQSFDVVVSGLALNEAVGGVSLLLTWNGGILGAPQSYTADPDAKMGTALDLTNNDFSSLSSGQLVLEFLADVSKDDAALKAAQGAGFRLATFSLTALALGVTPIDLLVFSPAGANGVPLSNGSGLAPLNASLVGTCVTVGVSNTVPPGSCAAVPEPASMMLIGSGLASVLAMARRRQAARKA